MSTAVPLLSHLKTPLAYQFNYLMLCIAWNVAGLILLANGEQALGPTASTSAIAILAGFGVALFIGAWRLPYLYLLASVLLLLIASSAVLPAYTKDPSLWPSDYWRYGGALLNGLGAFVCARGILAFWQWHKLNGKTGD